jgi:hypothetical protein
VIPARFSTFVPFASNTAVRLYRRLGCAKILDKIGRCAHAVRLEADRDLQFLGILRAEPCAAGLDPPDPARPARNRDRAPAGSRCGGHAALEGGVNNYWGTSTMLTARELLTGSFDPARRPLCSRPVSGTTPRRILTNVSSINRVMTKSLPALGCDDSDKFELSKLRTRQEEGVIIRDVDEGRHEPGEQVEDEPSTAQQDGGLRTCTDAQKRCSGRIVLIRSRKGFSISSSLQVSWSNCPRS